MVEDLIINASLVISLIFGFMKMRWNHNHEKFSQLAGTVLDGIGGGLMGLVLMWFSVDISNGTIVDFRYIPIVLMVLFVSDESAIISALIIAFGRFIFGQSLSAVIAFLLIFILLVGLIIINRKIEQKGTIVFKGSIMIVFSTIIYIFFFITRIEDPFILYPLLAVYFCVSISVGIFSIFFMNYLRTSEYLLRRYEIESSVDYLTGLKNVRKFNQILEYYEKKTMTKQSNLAIAMIDIDHFKQVNDTYGHSAGDYVLIELAKLMDKHLEKDAYVFRKGGEEFAALFPSLNAEKVFDLMDDCRKLIEVTPFQISSEHKLFLTISVGVSHYPDNTVKVEDLMNQADKKLYTAKENGRNQTIM